MGQQLTAGGAHPWGSGGAHATRLRGWGVVLRLALRRDMGAVQIISACLLPALAVIGVIHSMDHAEVRDHSGVFASGMLSPWLILMPLIVTLLTCGRFSAELAHRFITVQQTRCDARVLLAARYGSAMVIGFSLTFLFSIVSYVTAFHIWPLLGDPGIDPAGYVMAPEQTADFARHHEAFGMFLAFGDLPFGLVSSSWFGFCGAVYAAMGITACLLVRNRYLALALPMLVVFGETFGAEVLGRPVLALYYSAVPFGLAFHSDMQVTLPHLVLAAVVAVVAIIAIRGIPASGRLS